MTRSMTPLVLVASSLARNTEGIDGLGDLIHRHGGVSGFGFTVADNAARAFGQFITNIATAYLFDPEVAETLVGLVVFDNSEPWKVVFFPGVQPIV